jgi:hypothetical protein
VADAFASNEMPLASPAQIEHSPKTPSLSPSSPARRLSAKLAPPHAEQASSSTSSKRPMTFGDVSPLASALSHSEHPIPSPDKKNTLPLPPSDSDPDALQRRKSYDDGVRPLSHLFKQNTGSLNNKRGLPEPLHNTQTLSAPTLNSSKRHSINPGLTFNLDTLEVTSSTQQPSSSGVPHSAPIHRRNSHESSRILSPIKSEFPEPSSSRSSPLTHSPLRQEFPHSTFSPPPRRSLSPHSPEKLHLLNDALSTSHPSSDNTQTSIQPPPSEEVDQVSEDSTDDSFADAESVVNGLPPPVDDDGTSTPITIRTRKSFDHEPQSTNQQSLNSDFPVKKSRSTSRSRSISPRRADVPRSIDSGWDTEESDVGNKSTDSERPPLPHKRVKDGKRPTELKLTTDNIDSEHSFLDSEENSDVSEGSAVEERMSHTTFIAPALPPIRFSMTGNDFSDLLGAGGSSLKNLERLAKLSEDRDEATEALPQAKIDSSDSGMSDTQHSPADDDRTAVLGTPVPRYKTPDEHRDQHVTSVLVPPTSHHTLPKRSNTVNAPHSPISQSNISGNPDRSSSDSNHPSNMSNISHFSSFASDDSHEISLNSDTSMSSHAGGARITVTGPNSAIPRHTRHDMPDLVQRRLQEALSDANERGVQQLKLDKSFVLAILSTIEQRNQENAFLKTKFDGMKVSYLHH